MPLSVRDLALECVAHMDEEVSLETTLPAGVRPFLVRTMNTALEEMRTEAPALFRQTVGITWTAARSGTVRVTAGSADVTMGSLDAPEDGCTVRIGGDASLNEIWAEPTQDGHYLLLHPYSGTTTGYVEATAYGDAVTLDATVDRVLGAMLLHERRPLEVLNSREEWMRWSGCPGWQDYGMTREGQDARRTPGQPRAVWLESALDPEGGEIVYRARCAPLPAGDFRATLEVLTKPRDVQDEDLNEGADAYLPVPGGRQHLILHALVLYHWSGAPWFKNDSARAVIGANYNKALEQLRGFNANASTTIRLTVLP